MTTANRAASVISPVDVYIAAEVAATHSEGAIDDFYFQLKGRGKPSKVALTACMRKLVVRLNAMLAKGQTWEVQPN